MYSSNPLSIQSPERGAADAAAVGAVEVDQCEGAGRVAVAGLVEVVERELGRLAEARHRLAGDLAAVQVRVLDVDHDRRDPARGLEPGGTGGRGRADVDRVDPEELGEEPGRVPRDVDLDGVVRRELRSSR